MSDHFDPYHVWLGIPPEETAGGKPNHYRLLGLRLFEANPDVISNAVDQRRVYLRSVQAGKRAVQSQQLLNEVSAAGVCLLDEAKKRLYDDELRAKLAPAMPAPPVPAALPPVQPVIAAPSPLYTAATPVATRGRTVAPTPTTARSRKTHSSSSVVIVALAISGAAALLFVAAAGAWWAMLNRPPEVGQAASAATPADRAGKSQSSMTADARPATPTPNEERRSTPPTPEDRPAAPAVEERAGPATGADSKPPPAPRSTEPPPTVAASPPTKKQAKSISTARVGAQQRQALVFAGNESTQLAVPDEIARPGAEFTIELWARWGANEPTGILLDCGHLRIAGRRASENPNDPVFNMLEVLSSGSGNGVAGIINPGEWVHIAIVRHPDGVAWFVRGQPLGTATVQPGATLASSLSLGHATSASGSEVGFHGLVRDLRISRGRRYTTNFAPESKLSLDEQTLLLLKLEGPQPTNRQIENKAGTTPPAQLGSARMLPLTDDGLVAAELPDGTIDLLRAVNVTTGTLEGENFQSTGFVETRVTRGRSRVLVPYRPPAEYDVELEMTRYAGQGGAFVGLEIAGRPTIFLIDNLIDGKSRTGILRPATSQVPAASFADVQPLLATGQRRQITLKVRLDRQYANVTVMQGSVAMLENGQPIELLNCPSEFSIPLSHGMSLGSSDAHIRFHRAIVRPVNSGRAVSPLASAPRSPVSPSPPSISRRPLPDAATLAKGVEEARKLYESEAKAATKATQKVALAKRILDSGKAAQSDATARYVLIDLARKVFIQAGDVQEAVGAARLLEAEYEIPRAELLAATVEALDDAQLATDARSELARVASDLADAALDADQFERADRLAAVASQSAGKTRDSDLKKDIAQRQKRIARVAKEWTAAKASVEKLKSDPADGPANLAAGKFYCFTVEDFSAGLKYLAAGSDAQLADAAKRDLAAQTGDATKRVEAAAAWQQVATRFSERDDKLAVQRREKLHLQQAVGALTGLVQIKANKRLDELKDVGQAASKPATTTASSRGSIRNRNVSLVGRLADGNKDAGVLISYEHGYFITTDDFTRLLSTAGITTSPNLKIGLVGGFFLPVDQTVTLHQTGSSNSGGTFRVFVDNRQHGTVGFGYPTNSTASFRLQAGSHMIRWEMTGGEFGTAQLELKSDPAVTGAQVLIPIAVDRSIESAAKQSPTKTTIHWGK